MARHLSRFGPHSLLTSVVACVPPGFWSCHPGSSSGLSGHSRPQKSPIERLQDQRFLRLGPERRAVLVRSKRNLPISGRRSGRSFSGKWGATLFPMGRLYYRKKKQRLAMSYTHLNSSGQLDRLLPPEKLQFDPPSVEICSPSEYSHDDHDRVWLAWCVSKSSWRGLQLILL